MAVCPHCKTNSYIQRVETEPGTFVMQCKCGWRYISSIKMPSYFELVKLCHDLQEENKTLRDKLNTKQEAL